MLSFDVRALESKAAQVDALLGPDDPIWREEDPRPATPIHVTGRLSTAGEGRYYFSGRLEGTYSGECRRCLTDASAEVGGDVQFLFADEGDETDDPDVFPVDARAAQVDLRPAIREQWLLTAPTFLVCREECAGLCPRCGADLNEGPCACPPAADSRWNALRGAGGDIR